jgi:hypothetical protein
MGLLRRLLVPMLVLGIVLAAAPPALAQEAGFRGTAPAPGSQGLLVTTAAVSPSALAAALAAAGCDAETLGVIEAGEWVMYVPGAPPFANVGFPLALGADAPFYVRCRAGTASPFTLLEASGGQVGIAEIQTDARVGTHSGFDRFVIEFSGNVVPEWNIEYITEPALTCGEGAPVTVAGAAALQITLPQTSIADDEGQLTIPARQFTPGFPMLREAREICGFEGMAIWLLGLQSQQPFRVFELTSPARLVIDVPH